MDHWCYRDTVTILESVNPSYTELQLKQLLEDTESPITKKIQYAYQIKLEFYDSTDKRTSINMQALCRHLLTL